MSNAPARSNFSFRADLLARRTYQRPLESGEHETWDDVCQRVISHQAELWKRQIGRPLNDAEWKELSELELLMRARKVLPSGRVLWMAGTEQSKRTEIAHFNCSYLVVRDIFSAVDAFYLLLNGCGVGFKPEAGLLNGFSRPVKIRVIRSTRQNKGPEGNEEWYDATEGHKVYHLKVGDSGVAWAKAFGKLLAMKRPVDEVVLDFTSIRPSGFPLAGYGWLSSGDDQIAEAFVRICEILSAKADKLLDEIDIVDIINLVGTTLTSRRSAEIALVDATNRNSERFATMKKDHYENGKAWRSQSNNSIVYYSRPSKLELRGFFQQMIDSGGSEPGLINGEEALRRAPWFSGCNPCGEILLADGGLCNLVDVDLGKFIGTTDNLARAVELISRANYRQTCVTLKDGVLSAKWQETQDFLRLCGVGLTGLVKWMDNYGGADSGIVKENLSAIRRIARGAAIGMADELGTPRPKAVTTVKPSGTVGKVMDTTEGLHRPLGRFIFNRVKFSKHDRLVDALKEANYNVEVDPYSDQNVLVVLPVDNGPGRWKTVDGVEYGIETAIEQLDRYRVLMENYVDHNASITVSYRPEEIHNIVEWLYDNWDVYVGVSFILAQDPTKRAEDLGYPYLPQTVVSRAEYEEYTLNLREVRLVGSELLETDECAGGACPVR